MKETREWKNWSETAHCKPREVLFPTSAEEVCDYVNMARKEQRRIRVVGAGHSFTEIAVSEDYLMSLDHLTGVTHLDKELNTATILAGTRLHELSKQLAAEGYSQENLGDINVQSIAGAISTGTHGTGIKFGNLATQVLSFTLVTAKGETLTIAKEQDETLFHAGVISLGLLGVIVEITISVIPAPTYKLTSSKYKFRDLLEQLPTLIEQNRHFECFLFPYSDLVQIKTMNLSEQAPQSLRKHRMEALIVENHLFKLLSETVRLFPSTSRSISRLSAKAIGSSTIHGKSFDLFATERRVRFREMEYSIPLENVKVALIAIREKIETARYQVHFPIEVRMVKQDQFWLSPAYKRNSAYIAFHMYKGMPYENYFGDMEKLLQNYQGRPHWGKMHKLNLSKLKALYPKLDEFLNIRKQLDPTGLFLNDYVVDLFALQAMGDEASIF
ncbi:D-arabinono-1,4-lactone oxidase [Virgibacillus sp. Bac332]|uniref:D-arabinono-1,4-lactone oxidase n=1 Tax=Virgibacillus sp. Bac332 TaxID=2419842 RepID=UPI000EF51551|nr:D-arabinono-1,4-lactone oxidase [Virgibacillus sp. Bac332]